MEDFKTYLLSRRVVPENKLIYYLVWVNQFYAFCDKNPGDDVSAEEVDGFVKHLMKSREDWQVKQAKEAIQLFIYYTRRKSQTKAQGYLQSDALWRAVAQDMINVLRMKHRALSTVKAYLGWLRSFYRFVNGLSPHELNSGHVKDFLSDLAVERHVAPSTQNQAFNAILFLFRYVLDKELGDIEGTVRARQRADYHDLYPCGPKKQIGSEESSRLKYTPWLHRLYGKNQTDIISVSTPGFAVQKRRRPLPWRPLSCTDVQRLRSCTRTPCSNPDQRPHKMPFC